MPDNRSVCGECGDVYGEEWSPVCSCGKNGIPVEEKK